MSSKIPPFFLIFILLVNALLVNVSSSLYTVYNIDGDFQANDDEPYWCVWCSEGISYNYSFTDNGTISASYYGDSLKLATMKQHANHGFLDGRIKLDRYKVRLNFAINILYVNVTHPDEWGRVAMVFSFHTSSGQDLYLEYDVYRSPNCVENPPIEGRDFKCYVIGQQNVTDGWVTYQIKDLNSDFKEKYGEERYHDAYLYAIIYTIEFKNSEYKISGDDVYLMIEPLPGPTSLSQMIINIFQDQHNIAFVLFLACIIIFILIPAFKLAR